MTNTNASKAMTKAGATEIESDTKWIRVFKLNGVCIKLFLSDKNGCAGPDKTPEKVSSVQYEGDSYGISVSTAIKWASEKAA
jgi:hypothetical protein